MKNQTKPWWKSRTIWVNLVGLVSMIIQSQTGFVVEPEIQAAVLLFLNLVLRFDTSTALR